MKASLNQLQREYNNSINDIPEEKLKELFNKLYYEAYHSAFIEEDKETYEKTITTIEGLIKNTGQPKLFRAGKEAIVRQPVEVMVELYNKNKEETRDLVHELFKIYLLFLAGENNLLTFFIGIIDGIEEGKHSLQFLREQMTKVQDSHVGLLEIHQDDLDRTIKYYESKEDLSKVEIEGLERLKEIGEGV